MIEHLRFQVLGGLRAQLDGVELDLGGARQRRVLAVLLLSLGRPLPAERLAQLVWGDDVPASVRISLQSYISKLRTVLEPHRRPGAPSLVIGTRAGGYVIEVDASQVDLWCFEHEVAAGAEAIAVGHLDDAIARLGPALARWCPVLPELADEPVVLAAAQRAEAVRAAGTEALARARLALGDYHGAVVDLRTAVAEDPRAEAPWALLALALYRCGRQADALDAIASARRVLREECGLEVCEELRQLEADLLTQAPGLAVPTVASTTPVERVPGCRRGRRVRPSSAGRCATLFRSS